MRLYNGDLRDKHGDVQEHSFFGIEPACFLFAGSQRTCYPATFDGYIPFISHLNLHLSRENLIKPPQPRTTPLASHEIALKSH